MKLCACAGMCRLSGCWWTHGDNRRMKALASFNVLLSDGSRGIAAAWSLAERLRRDLLGVSLDEWDNG